MKSQTILDNYDLCEHCLGRLFAKNTSHKLLGRKILKTLGLSCTRCFICKNVFDSLPVEDIIQKSSMYEFSTFLIGLILKPSVIDRDDLIRSKFQLKADSIKTAITKYITKKLSNKTRAKQQHVSPDLTITVNLKDDSIDIHSKSVYLFARYTKSSRNLPQKQLYCDQCDGRGCRFCDFHGIDSFDSVQGKIAKFLYEIFDATLVKISWIGGEDKTSLVSGSGRPFFAKVLSPKKRKIKLARKISLGDVVISSCRMVALFPKEPLAFKSVITIHVETFKAISLENLSKLPNSVILVYDDLDRCHKKFVYESKYKKINETAFSLRLKVDGGLPIKRFVDGTDVSPSLSSLLKTDCKCKQFDFDDIILE